MGGLEIRTSGVFAERSPDGGVLLTADATLPPYGERITDAILKWAAVAPDRIALADRYAADGGWRTVTYAQLVDKSARIGEALLEMGLGQDRPVMLVGENRIEGALLMLAAYRAGVPVAPVTPAYSKGKGDIGRLASVMEVLNPGLIVVDDLAAHGEALSKAKPDHAALVGVAGQDAGFEALANHAPGPLLAAAERAVHGGMTAKVLFTSGSTGAPKGVINTHHMLTSNMEMMRWGWPFLDVEPPVMVDWLPWNHTFGSNFVFNTVLTFGGSLYIDDGKPMPGLIERSVANAADIGPTVHVNAPRGLDMTARVLARDEGLAEAYFARLGLVLFASSGLPARIRDDWRTLIARHAKRPVVFCSGWGATETAPIATALHFEAPEINNIGTPEPGVTIKLAPVGDRFEIRVKGPNVTPGYLGRPDLSAAAFDEDGFLKTGDVGRLADENDPSAGILIDGRLAEDFKLSSGVWVNVGTIRAAVLELTGAAVRDVALSGVNRDELLALIFLDADACKAIAGGEGDNAAMAAHAAVQAHIAGAVGQYNKANPGSSRRIAHFHIMPRPLDPGAGELTDKGTVNQRTVLAREAALCDDLHARLGAAAE